MLVATQKEYLNPFQMSEEVMIHQGTDDVIMVKLSLNLRDPQDGRTSLCLHSMKQLRVLLLLPYRL